MPPATAYAPARPLEVFDTSTDRVRRETVFFGGLAYHRYPDSKYTTPRRYFAHNRWYLHRDIWQAANGPIPSGWHVHHKDGNWDNNEIGNLESLPPREHRHRHPDALRKFVDAGTAYHRSPEGRAASRLALLRSCRSRKPTRKVCTFCGKTYLTKSLKRQKLFCSPACSTKSRRQSAVDSVQKICPVCTRPFVSNRYDRQTCCSKKCAQSLRWHGEKVVTDARAG